MLCILNVLHKHQLSSVEVHKLKNIYFIENFIPANFHIKCYDNLTCDYVCLVTLDVLFEQVNL